MTYIELSLIKTNLPLFPFVIDTPQQNGQDMNNLSNTFSHLENLNFTQLIIGSETIPNQSSLKNYKIIEFKDEYSVLNVNDFPNVLESLNEYNLIINSQFEG